MVADLSTDQQAALFLLISQLKGGGEAGATTATASAQTDEEKIMATINNVKIALEALDVDKLLDTFSPDFDHPQVGGKDEARAMLTMGLQSGYADNGEVSLEDIELDIDADAGTATAYPLDLSSPAGAVSVELELQKESDGSWLITTLYVDGI
jgi:ketosteroid isomerase-like protein